MPPKSSVKKKSKSKQVIWKGKPLFFKGKPVMVTKRSSKPGRLRSGSKTQVKTTQAVSKAMSQVAETFYNPLKQVEDALISVATPGSAQVAWRGYTLGQTVPLHLPGYDAALGMDFTSAKGKYVYLKKGQILVTIEMNPTAQADSLTYVRMILYKNKRTASPAGTSVEPAHNLFLQNDGTYLGQDDADFTGKIAMNALTNKQNFIIYRDHTMTLSNPRITPDGDRAYSGKYPCKRQFKLDLPFWKKVRLSPDKTPEDIDYHFNLVFYVTTQGNAGTPNDAQISFNNHLVTWTDM